MASGRQERKTAPRRSRTEKYVILPVATEILTADGGPVTSDVTPASVHQVLGRSILADGMDLVLDLERSRGSYLVDARTGRRYLDMFTFFASSALGMNHPALADDPAFRAELATAAVNKPSNSDIYTVAMARFVDTFARVLGDPALPHLFFIDGGALAVENALKVAFDWKAGSARPADWIRRWAPGAAPGAARFTDAAAGTLSLTNTDPIKVARFPKFDWRASTRRISVPARISLSLKQIRCVRRAPRSRRTHTTSPASSPNPSRVRAATGISVRSSSPRCVRTMRRVRRADDLRRGADRLRSDRKRRGHTSSWVCSPTSWRSVRRPRCAG